MLLAAIEHPIFSAAQPDAISAAQPDADRFVGSAEQPAAMLQTCWNYAINNERACARCLHTCVWKDIEGNSCWPVIKSVATGKALGELVTWTRSVRTLSSAQDPHLPIASGGDCHKRWVGIS